MCPNFLLTSSAMYSSWLRAKSNVVCATLLRKIRGYTNLQDRCAEGSQNVRTCLLNSLATPVSIAAAASARCELTWFKDRKLTVHTTHNTLMFFRLLTCIVSSEPFHSLLNFCLAPATRVLVALHCSMGWLLTFPVFNVAHITAPSLPTP